MIKGTPKTYIPDDWDLTADRYVGFMDIMGFKKMVEERTSEYIYSLMTKLHKVIKTNAAGFGEHHSFDADEQLQNELNVTIISFSDSIIIFSKDDSKRCFDSFVLTISSLSEDLFMEGVPFKGGVAHGKMTLDFAKSIYFGESFIQAYELQEKIAFYSVACHESFEKKINKIEPYHCLLQYECPYKPGFNTSNSNKHFTIYPMPVNNDDSREYVNIVSKLSVLKDSASEKIKKYYEDTLVYLEQCRTPRE